MVLFLLHQCSKELTSEVLLPLLTMQGMVRVLFIPGSVCGYGQMTDEKRINNKSITVIIDDATHMDN